MIKVWNNLYILLYLLSKKVGYILVGSIYNKTGINMKGYIKKLLRESLLNEELSDKEMNNLKRLIDSGQGDNIEMAFMIASGHGEDIENELLVYWYNSIRGTNLTWDEMRNLKKLYLDDMELTSLPESIENLTNLKWLHLGYNKLETLPDSIVNLKNLEKLWLYQNKLTSLPEDMDKLTNLNYLVLHNNPISDEEIERIKKLLPNTDIETELPF